MTSLAPPSPLPMPGPSQDITLLLQRMHDGDADARDELLASLYDDLHGRARREMGGQAHGHTLQPTALVNEAYFRLVGQRDEPWADRHHFLKVASRAMRQILVDHARRKARCKRSPNGERVPIESLVVDYEERAGDLLSLDAALERLAEFDAEMAQVVELRFFGGQSMQEAADAIGRPKSTLENKWTTTRAWLAAQVRRED